MLKTAAILTALQLLSADANANRDEDETEAAADDATQGSADDLSERGSAPAPQPRRSTDRGADPRLDRPWVERWAPERNTGGLGFFAGTYVPNRRTANPSPGFEDGTQELQTLDGLATTIGGRAFYYPSRFVGLEGEGAALLTRMSEGDRSTSWTARGSVVAQVGLWSATPFVAVGAGALSDPTGDASSIDAAIHIGGGIKLFATRYTQIRIDLRDVMNAARGIGQGENHNFEATLGMSLTLGRKRDPKRSKPASSARNSGDDRDEDGVLDGLDACIDTWGVMPSGCPLGHDRDDDGVRDGVDACIATPGDGDDGCPTAEPAADTDGDGILDANDACVNEAETPNYYQDGDGCPDEIPSKIHSIDDVIGGIYFDLAKTRLTPESIPRLDEAVALLTASPELRIKILGYTDKLGTHEFNMDLSQRRAEAVRTYLIDHGIAPDRLSAHGRGSDYPIANNETEQGRASNRRIEFIVEE